MADPAIATVYMTATLLPRCGSTCARFEKPSRIADAEARDSPDRQVDGSAPKQLHIHSVGNLPAPDPASILRPTWSPDGSLIAFNDMQDGLFVVRPDGRGLRRLAKGILPAWSPDGTRIAFVGAHPSHTNGVIRRDGTGLRQLPGCRCALRGPGFLPNVSWSSGGSRIAYVSGDGQSISTVKANGTGATRVVGLRGKRYHGPTRPLWRPSDRK